MSPRTGRPKSENSKNKRLEIRLTDNEFELIDNCATALKTTRTDVIMLGVKLLESKIQGK